MRIFTKTQETGAAITLIANAVLPKLNESGGLRTPTKPKVDIRLDMLLNS